MSSGFVCEIQKVLEKMHYVLPYKVDSSLRRACQRILLPSFVLIKSAHAPGNIYAAGAVRECAAHQLFHSVNVCQSSVVEEEE